jgi:FkbM family methyltransferase
MDKTINYKGHPIKFFDLLETGDNMDEHVISGELFNGAAPDVEAIVNILKLKSDDVVYDIGAYIGTYSIPMALEGMSVYSFEGFPDNFERIKKNCKPYKNIKLFDIAVSNENKTTQTKFNDCTALPPEIRTIKYVKFDDYIKENDMPLPDFVKMDIEGMETVALLEMNNLLKNVRPIWQIGYHFGLDIKYDGYPGFVMPEDGGFDFDTFIKLGYWIFDQSGDRCPNFSGYGEYLCIPSEKIKKIS